MTSIAQRIADELHVRVSQVDATIALLDDKSTVPFIARYRKEATGGLDDTQLRALEERLAYLRELEDRRATIANSIAEQGKMTPELAAAIAAADTKARLEDLYLPYKPKRRTRAQIAREAGLEPLALALLQNPQLVPEQAAAKYVDREKGVADIGAALEGARWILMETLSENAELVGGLRQLVWERGEWRSTVVPGKEAEGVKFSDYLNASERVKSVPSHRVLALLRGRKEGILRLTVALPDEEIRLVPASLSAALAEKPVSRRRAGRLTPGSSRRFAGHGRSGCSRTSRSRPSSGCASTPRPKPFASSAVTCTTCSWPRPRDSARRSGWTLGSGPA